VRDNDEVEELLQLTELQRHMYEEFKRHALHYVQVPAGLENPLVAMEALTKVLRIAQKRYAARPTIH